MIVADLSPEAIAQRKLDEQVQRACRKLTTHADVALQRAGRAHKGTHQRERYVAVCRHLRACAVLLASDEGMQTTLRDEGLLDAGWKHVATRVTQIWRQREAKRESGDPRP